MEKGKEETNGERQGSEEKILEGLPGVGPRAPRKQTCLQKHASVLEEEA